ncbi:hypothetical protein H2203_003090 [Taxawa tesnikishii (nom. ined.)]|nr:hypothetical protein H2203_003090 [Dothideales sp. JES 119]
MTAAQTAASPESSRKRRLSSSASVSASKKARATDQHDEQKPSRLGQLNCMICMDNFTDMTVTHCGHVFCNECLHQALLASQRASERGVGSCPACRKSIKPTKKDQVIPLLLMKKVKRNAATPTKVR